MGKIIIRVDIDTVTCVRNLEKLLFACNERNIKLTVFSTLGCTIDRVKIIKKIFEKNKGFFKYPKLSNRKKMKTLGYMETILVNPDITKRQINILSKFIDSGHQVALHGGNNHGTWLYELDDVLLSETLHSSIEIFIENFGEKFAFSSPGYKKNRLAYPLLSESGCSYVSDSLENKFFIKNEHLIDDFPVTIFGRGTVDYLESLHARQVGINSCVERMSKLIANNGNEYDVYYTHPCYCMGVGEKYFLNVLDRVFLNFESLTMDEVYFEKN